MFVRLVLEPVVQLVEAVVAVGLLVVFPVCAVHVESLEDTVLVSLYGYLLAVGTHKMIGVELLGAVAVRCQGGEDRAVDLFGTIGTGDWRRRRWLGLKYPTGKIME